MEVTSLRYDKESRQVYRGDDEIILRAKEKELLEVLIRFSPGYVSRETLCQEVWDGRYVSDFTINQTINSLRKKIDDTEKLLIQTVPRKGYVLGEHLFETVHTTVSKKKDEETSCNLPALEACKNHCDNSDKSFVFTRHKHFRRVLILIALFFGAGGVGVGVAALKGLSREAITKVYIDGNRFDIYDGRVEYRVGNRNVICELVERTTNEGERITTDKTACRSKL